MLEEAIPSAAKVGTNKGLPPRDVLEYVLPGDIQLSSLKLGKQDKKVCHLQLYFACSQGSMMALNVVLSSPDPTVSASN